MASERAITRIILDEIVEPLRKVILAEIEPLLNRAAEISRRNLALDQSPFEDIQTLLTRLEDEYHTPQFRNRLRQRLAGAYADLGSNHGRQFRAQIDAALGRTTVSIGTEIQLRSSADFGAVQTFLDAGVSSSLRRYTSFVGTEVAAITDIVERGVLRGERASSLSNMIQSRLGESPKRAALIARNEIGNATAALTNARQVAAGITEAQWDTSGDERVRKTHDDIDGTTFTISQGHPGVGGARPGEPVNCRCNSIPILPT